MSTLAHFQHAFAAALSTTEDTPHPEVAALVRQPGFSVYRNTWMKAAIDALQANYPSVARLVGEAWFRAAAAVYAHTQQPSNPCLLHYGADFSAFLQAFEPAVSLPYLPAVARLDRLRTESHVAQNAHVLDAGELAAMAPEALAACRLQPHPAARWVWFEDAPAFSIWCANNRSDTGSATLEWQPEGALLTRPQDTVQWIALDCATHAFLDACASGQTLADAAQAALAVAPQAELGQTLATLLHAGAFKQPDSSVANPISATATERN